MESPCKPQKPTCVCVCVCVCVFTNFFKLFLVKKIKNEIQLNKNYIDTNYKKVKNTQQNS